MEEGILDEMAQLIEVFIIFSENFAVFSGRDDRYHALFLGLLHDGVTIIAFVRKQIVRTQSFNEARCKAAIRCGALRNNDSDRQTKRIHGQV